MSQYKHLTFQERIRIEELLEKKVSINMIAKDLKKSRSTIAREINSALKNSDNMK
ncbi:MAG: helix-turn-helix domain-containing protein [Lachnospiraceae bacterium]|nr:helix-turn-helix domain-containing protein [Lachnospiraceae bacterium]